MCSGPTKGVCWLLPPTCPSGMGPHWEPCTSPGPGGPPGPCMTTCDAIRSGKAYRNDPKPTCP
jgi:hypothetical protein